MNQQIERPIGDIAARAHNRYRDAIDGVREGTATVASRLARGKKPVRTLSRYGVKLSAVSHRTVNKLWKRQTKLVENQLDAIADRLKAAAKAAGLRDLLKTQIDMVPPEAARLADEARVTLEIFRGAGSEVRGIVVDAVDELRGRKKPVPKTAPRRRATPKARPVTGPVVAERAGPVSEVAA